MTGYFYAVKNTQHGTITLMELAYPDYQPGDVIFPLNLRKQYPGPDENRHVVKTHALSREGVERFKKLYATAKTREV